MKHHIMPAIRLSLLCLILFSGIYTLIILGMAQISPGQGQGTTLSYQGKKYYSNIGQQFNDDRYFWSRPSAVNYNAAAAGGSNKGPSNPEYLKTVQERIDYFMLHNPGITKADIPVDMLTASGSGLDPHISPKGAEIQVKRIALQRGIEASRLMDLIVLHTEKPLWGLFGPEKINVLELNIALDQLK